MNEIQEDFSMSQGNILIVEDDRDIREGVRILLESEGYHVDEAENGTEGLKKLNIATDLVILDIMMPGISKDVQCSGSLSDREIAGIGQADRADGRRRRLSAEAVFLHRTAGAREGADPPLPDLSGKAEPGYEKR
jgi:CheY-like chemotaxis protein